MKQTSTYRDTSYSVLNSVDEARRDTNEMVIFRLQHTNTMFQLSFSQFVLLLLTACSSTASLVSN